MSMSVISKTPLENWIAQKIAVSANTLTRTQIERYQLQKLQETIHLAFLHSPFYRKHLAGFAETELTSLTDLSRFPFTLADDIRRCGLQFLCVSQDEISRVVTLDSSGTTGRVKRLCFTPLDQELTIDFFRQGMAALVGTGDRVLILLPGDRQGSVGDLLRTALERLGARPIPHGIVRSTSETIKRMVRENVDSIVGIPAQALALARYTVQSGSPVQLKSVLLSTDHVPKAISRELQRVWDCQVFEHYGMTEMGLGGGIDCAAHAGYHLREADLYFEVVDPLTGAPLPEGQEGEVVFTTLTRRGMPLIRYRTGDISRFVPGPCPCGTILRRLERVTRRKNSRILLSGNLSFTLADLDEAFFAVDSLINFRAAVDSTAKTARLTILAWMMRSPDEAAELALRKAADTIPAIAQACGNGSLTVKIKTEYCMGDLVTAGTAKRAITELNKANGQSDDIFDSAWEASP